MQSKMDELQNFGYRFLGPIVTSFFDEIEKHRDQEPLFFLAREGYHLKSLYEYYCASLDIRANTSYLLCSRVFLFKLCLADEELISLSLEHPFNGDFKSLLISRYGFNGAQINKIKSSIKNSDKLLSIQISLPSRQDVAVDALSKVSKLFKDELEIKRKLYLNYLEDIGLFSYDKKINVVDIGFSGTIQKLLSSIAGKATTGHYMVTTRKAKNTSDCTFIGHFAKEKSFGEGFALLDRSLYLESFLTAPHGQVNDIFDGSDRYRFGYSTKTRTQSEFYLIEQVVEGVKMYMDDTIESGLQLDTLNISDYFASIVKRPQNIPQDLRNILEVDDHISGFGVLNPTQVFG